MVRRGVPVHETFTVRQPRGRQRTYHPVTVLAFGFSVAILIGTMLLSLPFATADGDRVAFIDAVFTATSAVCVTGLVVLDTGTQWSTFGHIVILGLIQLGGFGFMVSSTLIYLLLGRRTSLRQRLLLGETLGIAQQGQVVRLVRRIAVTTLAIEAVGTLFLWLRFKNEMSTGQAIWWGIFHSVSAHNNAGFDLFGGFRSLTMYADDSWILAIIGVLVILGAISFTVMADVWSHRSWRRLTVDTKLVLATTSALFMVAFIFFIVVEWNNPNTLGNLPLYDRITNSVFYGLAPRTAGFTSIEVAAYADQTKFFTMATMFIGGAAGSTAGGIKIQTFILLFFAIVASARASSTVVAFGREIATSQVFRALSVALLSIAVVFSLAVLLAMTETFVFLDVFFEVVSAFGTVGLSPGITPDLTNPGRILTIVAMFIGRIGPLSLALLLASLTPRANLRYAEDNVKIG